MRPEVEQRDDSTSVPVGTVTMLLTDVEGSTKLWEEHADAMQVAIRRHHELAHERIELHDGYRPPDQGEGDSVFAVFAHAAGAVACALDLQRAFAAEPWPDDAELRVRIALHTGALELRDERNYAGVALSRCARLRAIAHGGQTVLSEATRVLAANDLPAGADVKDLGSHRLKDLAAPEHVFQLTHAELEADFPPLRSLDARPNNLPVQLTRFVGRESELDELAELAGRTRLLTLTGTGGGGKTRLALQLAAQLVERYPDGVWLSELAPVSDAALVPRVVASAMGVREQKGRPIADTLVDHLRERRALLVLDNCEHLIESCARFAEKILATCPGVAILATSREPVSVAGETLWRVGSLSESESVQLFVDRAAAAQPAFLVTEDTSASIAAVCRRLEGIPLAIELAAAGLRAFSLEEVRRRLEGRFKLLGAPLRTALAHQRTLEAAIDWSYDLLSEHERTLFRRLAVFAGGFGAEAAERVCSDADFERDDVVDLLGGLVLKSLVLPDGEGRFRLLESIREYAATRLGETGEGTELRDRHLEWAIAFAERAEPELRGPEQQEWLDRLHGDLDNFRAAFGWSRERARLEAGLRLASALRPFWIVRADWGEGREWVEADLAQRGDVEAGVRAKALLAAGELAYVLSDFEASTGHFQEALAIADAIGDARTKAEALMWLANEADLVGKHAGARELMEESVAIYRELGDDPSLARSLGGLAWLENDFRRTRTLLEETLAIRRRLGNREYVAWALVHVGLCARSQGDYAAARAAYGEALSLARDIGYKRQVARCLTQLGDLDLLEGDLDRARAAFEESLPLWRDTGHQTGLVGALRGLGDLARLEGRESDAASFLEECLRVSRDIGWPGAEAEALDSLAALARTRDDLDEAARLHTEARSIWRTVNDAAGEAASVRGLGLVAAARGERDTAVRLLDEAATLRDAVGAALPPSELAEDESVRA